MFKTIANMLVGAMVAGAVSAALAVTGQAPVNGFQTPDGTWLLGLANGVNYSYQSSISAAGTSQAAATQLAAGIELMEVDTASGSATGVALPPCFAGTQFTIYNNTSTNLVLYPSIANNSITGAQDTINNSTSLALNAYTATSPACAKNGVWGAS